MITQEQKLLEYTASKNGEWVSKRDYQLILQLSQSGRAINTVLHKRKDFYDKWLAAKGWVFEQRMREDGKPYQDEWGWTYFRVRAVEKTIVHVRTVASPPPVAEIENGVVTISPPPPPGQLFALAEQPRESDPSVWAS